MASFREHVGFSGLLGVAYGLGAQWVFDFTPQQSALAGCLAGVGGMLPDLDAPTGKPGQEIFSLTAAIVPLVLIGRVLQWTGLPPDTETVMLLLVAMYFTVRYGLAWVVKKLSVHRGMFHSIPATIIAAELTYLAFPSELTTVKLLMAGAIATGFFSHLLLDEVYAVSWYGPIPQFKRSFGTAIKFVGRTFAPTAFTYGLLATLTMMMLQDAGLISPPQDLSTPPIADEFSPRRRTTEDETNSLATPFSPSSKRSHPFHQPEPGSDDQEPVLPPESILLQIGTGTKQEDAAGERTR
jgi:membrane-bound metal-dependent hydrolase YbcI (DUF457 family)